MSGLVLGSYLWAQHLHRGLVLGQLRQPRTLHHSLEGRCVRRSRRELVSHSVLFSGRVAVNVKRRDSSRPSIQSHMCTERKRRKGGTVLHYSADVIWILWPLVRRRRAISLPPPMQQAVRRPPDCFCLEGVGN